MSLISAKTLWNITVLQGTDFDQKIISGKDEYGKCGFYLSSYRQYLLRFLGI